MSAPKYASARVEVGKVHRNVCQDVVVITLDRLRLLVSEHLRKAEKANEWQAALGVFASLLAAIATTTFKETLGVPGDVWRALFLIATFLSFAWLARGLVRYYRAETIDDLLAKIKNSDET